jgi:ADP-L-glycero-D-manno-heptose 6-epimerase
MIIVTGGAGFIGSNIIKGLNAIGRTDILVVDDLTDGTKFRNLAVSKFYDYLDYEDFLNKIVADKSLAKSVDAIFHQGACSVTTEWNGRYMMRNNYEYTKQLLHYCAKHRIPLIYASSAAVYGGNQIFKETSLNEVPLNVYGYSKWQFDLYLLQHLAKIQSPVFGLRYFNVYGPHEQHKSSMASVAFHFMNQLRATGVVKLFEGNDGYANGEQLRDFIYVDDVVKVNLWLLEHARSGRKFKSGIYNVGTGQARSFNDVAKILIAANGSGKIEYIPFPEKLKGAYQSFTQADIAKLREAGYTAAFHSLEQGLQNYFAWMNPVARLADLEVR